MDEDIVAFLAGDEAETLADVKPLHNAGLTAVISIELSILITT